MYCIFRLGNVNSIRMTSIATSSRQGAKVQAGELKIDDRVLHRKRISQNLHIASYGHLRHPTSSLLELHIMRIGYLRGTHDTTFRSTHYLTQPFANPSAITSFLLRVQTLCRTPPSKSQEKISAKQNPRYLKGTMAMYRRIRTSLK